MKIKLYLDFDGVILDTVDYIMRDLERLNITDEDGIREFCQNVNWEELINKAQEINNSIDNINKIIDSNLFDVEILTHINSKKEGETKIEYLQKQFPNTIVNLVEKSIEKCDVVNPYNSILIDDYLGNLDKWYENGGIPIKFSNNNKECKYHSISSLDEIIELYNNLDILKCKKRVMIK